jgi:hypothetical protein
MYYYGARYYAAWICRFVSVDPLANEYLEWSPDVYCADNPIKYIDPDGREVKDTGYTSERKTYKGLKNNPAYKAFSKTKFAKKYSKLFTIGDMKKHDLHYVYGSKNKGGSLFGFYRNGVVLHISDLKKSDMANLKLAFVVSIPTDRDSIGKEAETLVHEVFQHNVAYAVAARDILKGSGDENSKMKALIALQNMSEISYKGGDDKLYWSEGGQKDHVKYALGFDETYNDGLLQLKEFLSPEEFAKAIDKAKDYAKLYLKEKDDYNGAIIKEYIKKKGFDSDKLLRKYLKKLDQMKK